MLFSPLPIETFLLCPLPTQAIQLSLVLVWVKFPSTPTLTIKARTTPHLHWIKPFVPKATGASLTQPFLIGDF